MMANDNEKPLLSGFLIPSTQFDRKPDPKRKRFRRCRSAPVFDFVPGEINGTNCKQSPQSSDSFLEKIHPSLKKIAGFLLLYVVVGSTCFYIVRNQIDGLKTDAVLDSVYFCIVTMTSVGYGDLVPNTATTKLLACVFVFSGMGMICLLLSRGADYIAEKQEILLIKALHLHQKFGPTDILKEMECNKVRYKCYMMLGILIMLVVVGTVFLATVEKLDIVDAFYCVCSTITTLGYGDKSFSTRIGRIFAIFWILASTISLAQFLVYVAELNAEGRQKELVHFVLTRKMTHEDLEAADIDENGIVGVDDFIIYKLKEMGKITQEDISLLLQEFENLDVDQSGTLSTSDLMLAQTPQ